MTLKEKLCSIESSTCYTFRQTNENRCELLIDRQGWCGDYSIEHARRIVKELGHNWKNVFKPY